MPAPRPAVPWLVRVVVAVLALALGAAAAAPAWAEESDSERLTFGIGPADDGPADSGRAIFAYGLTPGGVAYDRVAVLNYADEPQTFEVSAHDAVASDGGGLAVIDDSRPNADVGSWIELRSPRRVEVPARGEDGGPGRVVIPFTVSAPADAEPGDHAGAVVVSLTVKGASGGRASVDLVQRVAARAYVRVAGPVRPELVVTRLDARWQAPSWPWQQGRLAVDYAVTNSGNVRLGVEPRLRVGGPATGQRTTELTGSPELLPNGELAGSTTVEGLWPSGRVTVELVATPAAAVATEAPELGPVSRSAKVWALAWWLLAVPLLLLLPAALLVRRTRRRSAARRRSDSPRHRAPADPLADRLVGSR